jgi:hypothetical protein
LQRPGWWNRNCFCSEASRHKVMYGFRSKIFLELMISGPDRVSRQLHPPSIYSQEMISVRPLETYYNSSEPVWILWRVYPLLGNDSVNTFPRKHTCATVRSQ